MWLSPKADTRLHWPLVVFSVDVFQFRTNTQSIQTHTTHLLPANVFANCNEYHNNWNREAQTESKEELNYITVTEALSSFPSLKANGIHR